MSRLVLGRFHQKPDAALALPFVGIQPEGQFDSSRQLLGPAEPDAIHGLPLVFEFQGQMFFAHQSL